jgi:diguanylate cyclase
MGGNGEDWARMATQSHTTARRLSLLVGSAALLALGCAGAAGWSAATGERPAAGPVGLCVAVLFAGVAVNFRTRLGAQRLELSWGEAAMMLGLALVPPAWVVLCTPVGVGAWLLKCRQPPIKTVYNLSSYTIAAAAGAAIISTGPSYRDGGPVALVLLAAAGLVAGLITHVAVAGVIAVAQDLPLLASWRAGAGLQLLSAAGNVATAVTVLILTRHDPRLVAALPLVGLCLHQGYVGRLRGRDERAAAQRQLAVFDALAGLDIDEAGVAARAAAEITTLLSADLVEVELCPGTDRAAAVHQHPRRGQPWRGRPADAPRPVGRLLADVAIPGEDGQPVGHIRVWLAGGSADLQLSPRDQVALRTLAPVIGTTLANARAHRRLREAAADLAHQASHDRITDLPAHNLFLDQTDDLLARSRGGHPQDPAALCLIDIGGFREIVRTLGRAAAEHLLRHAADQLRATSLPGELLAHIGGDSFAVFLHRDPDPEQIRATITTHLAAVGTPVRLEPGGAPLSLQATAGITYCPSPAAASATELLRQAAAALDHARTLGEATGWYDPTKDAASSSALVLAAELRTALTGHQLELHYQPILDLTDGYPIAIEALARWRHPTRGLLRPSHFLSVLQSSPRDHAHFSTWYLTTALRERSHWDDTDLPVAVNLDARALLDRDLATHVEQALTAHDVPPDQLMFDLPADAALSTLDTVDRTLADLRSLGVRIAVDDFGTGYSSLTQLLRIPATHLKISADLIADMLATPQAATLVRAAIDIGAGTGLHVTALGVATTHHATTLQTLGCPAAQGPHLVTPLTAHRLRQFLATTPRKPPNTGADVINLPIRRASNAGRDHP